MMFSLILQSIIKENKIMDKRFKKKTGEELREYLQFQRRGYSINNKKR